MSDGLPDERRLRAVEQQVLTRIRRRAAIRTRVASSAAGVAILVGAVVLVHPALPSVSGSAGSGGGTAAGSASKSYSQAGVRCHETSAAGSVVRIAPLPAHPDAASVATACAAALPKVASGSDHSTPSPPASTLVVCRAEGGGFEVFPKDGHPGTLCTRNGLTAG